MNDTVKSVPGTGVSPFQTLREKHHNSPARGFRGSETYDYYRG
jgi:hypothetical protein